MDKKGKMRPTAPSGLSDDALKDLATRALEVYAESDGLTSFLDELGSLPPNSVSLLATDLARRGQERALPLLAAMVQREDLAPAAAEALGWIKSQEAGRVLAELAANSPSRETRKAAARGLHRLRSTGLQVEASRSRPSEGPATVPAAQAPAPPGPRAWASSVDGLGSRFVFLSTPRPLGGNALVFLMLNDEEGMKEARVGHTHHDGEAQSRVDTVSRESHLPHVEVPSDYARHLVREAREKAQASGRPLPVDYMVWKELIGEPQESWDRPPVYQELNAAQLLMEPGLLEESGRLLDLREFRNWLLDVDRMRPYAQEMEQAKKPSLVLTSEAQGDREERVLSKALEDLMARGGRARYKRRLEEMSYVLLHTGRERDGKRALAAAVALERESTHSRIYLPGSRPSDLALGDKSPLRNHPFFRRLIEESLERALEEITKDRKVILAG